MMRLPLVEASGHHRLLPAPDRGLEQVVPQARLGVLAQEVGGEAHVAGAHRVALLHEPGQLLEGPAGEDHPLLFALDRQLAAVATDADLEPLLEEAQVLVVGPEKGLDPSFRHGDAGHG
jgi:hypothetical protein